MVMTMIKPSLMMNMTSFSWQWLHRLGTLQEPIGRYHVGKVKQWLFNKNDIDHRHQQQPHQRITFMC